MRKKQKLLQIFLFSASSLLIGIYSFSQALKIPLSSLSAEKVLCAWEILNGSLPVTGWHFNPFELPFFLICTKIFGLSTFTAIAASTCFFLLLYCCGLLILFSHKQLDCFGVLIWTAICGLPDPVWLEAIQGKPILLLSLLLLPQFLSEFFLHRKYITALASLLCGFIYRFYPAFACGISAL